MRSVFKSPELKNYELIRAIRELAVKVPLPDEIKQVIGGSGSGSRVPGAYPGE